jgi:hypothetical protein
VAGPASATAPDKRAEIRQLTGVRGLAAGWVMLYHFQPQIFALAPELRPLSVVMRGGYFAVDLFFVLSGFILAHVYYDGFARLAARSWGTFLVRRLAADPDRFPDLSLSVVKLLGNGEYALERPGHTAPDGHFGLAVRDYTHSTAPNRRFPDLVTHRLLKAALAGGRPPYPDAELGELARHCTEQEDAAAKVERQVRKSAAAMLLAPRVGQRFDAIVTGAAPKGTWVRIDRPAVEGKVVRGARGLDVGDRVQVELLSTDVENGFIDFARAEGHR